jgi:hypothetical protein
MALPDYNRQFMEKIKSNEPIFNNALKYGVKVIDLSASTIPLEAKQYWRVVGIHHLTGSENMSNHHVYCDVLDGDGRRINQSRLTLTQENTAPVFAVVDKPANEPGTNFPLWSKTRATVAVSYPANNPLPSEAVTGIRTDHADEEIGNTWGHHSFYVVFQLTPIPEPQPEEKPAVIEVPDIPGPAEGTGFPPLSLEETIALVGEPEIIPLNPEAMFYKIAKAKNLGERLTKEYDVVYLGRNYRAQTYERGIVYAEVGDWGNVKLIPRTN